MLAYGMPGATEWLIILAVLLLVFGGKKLPQLARGMGQSILEFKRGVRELEGIDEEITRPISDSQRLIEPGDDEHDWRAQERKLERSAQ